MSGTSSRYIIVIILSPCSFNASHTAAMTCKVASSCNEEEMGRLLWRNDMHSNCLYRLMSFDVGSNTPFRCDADLSGGNPTCSKGGNMSGHFDHRYELPEHQISSTCLP